MIVDPNEIKTGALHGYMLSSIAPRPIAFVSTVDKLGHPNLSPFSFFNAFGSNPPIVVFSPARRVRDNTIKHTLENIYEVDECVINVVNHAMVYQASLSSTEYPKGVNEFMKAGFTEVPSLRVRPPRVKESPVQLECKVKQVIETGMEGGAANLVVCEILLMHIADEILDENKRIDQHKIDLVARMGQDWYCRASGPSLFEIPKPLATFGIGIDNLPEHIRNSKVLTGNHLGQLGNIEKMPGEAEIESFQQSVKAIHILKELRGNSDEKLSQLHFMAKTLLDQGDVKDAWEVLLLKID